MSSGKHDSDLNIWVKREVLEAGSRYTVVTTVKEDREGAVSHLVPM